MGSAPPMREFNAIDGRRRPVPRRSRIRQRAVAKHRPCHRINVGALADRTIRHKRHHRVRGGGATVRLRRSDASRTARRVNADAAPVPVSAWLVSPALTGGRLAGGSTGL
ncbi:hypothetical protein KCP69_12570 [Salmonella enterica subsp. enterica]|nr:hypothetical protein KCP69_12570 [Salmonella enterica subsp. enterica]